METEFKYIFGPVYSWRLGMSLGIDPVSDRIKICNFDCPYCQIGRTKILTNERKDYVPVEAIVDEIKRVPQTDLDFITFSGRGEPTLAKNLGQMIKAIRAFRKEKIAIITSAALLGDKETQQDCALADIVLAKLDAFDKQTFKKVNEPAAGIDFFSVVEAIKSFRKVYKEKLALQMMFVEDNKKWAAQMAEVARSINADEIQINTPLRASPIKPLTESDLAEIKKHFKGLPAVTVFEKERKTVKPMDEKKTMLRHGVLKTKQEGARR